MAELLRIHEPSRTPRAPQGGFALFRLGFRPFYLMAALLAAGSVALWVLQFAGFVRPGVATGPLWHAHEMVFGFALAVVVGFLFTAVRNWTERPTPTGGWLAAIALLWLAGRVAVWLPFPVVAGVLNVAFPVAAAVGIGQPLIRSKNRRNLFFVAVLLGFAMAQALFHLTLGGALALDPSAGLRLGLDLVLFVVAVMAGRVVPMFTANGVRGTNPRRHPQVERAALGSVLVLLVADALALPSPVLATICLAAAVAHGARLALWTPWRTGRVPLVWILHAAYAWIVVHLLLRVGAELQWVAASLATHALTVGAIGGVIIGMITRTARGHTGRPLQADRWEVTAYALVMAAGIVRVLVPLAVPSLYLPSVLGAGALWAAAFTVYSVRYWPVLTRPRLDGRPG